MAIVATRAVVTLHLQGLDGNDIPTTRNKEYNLELHGADEPTKIANVGTDISAFVTDFNAVSEAQIVGWHMTIVYETNATVTLEQADLWHEGVLSVSTNFARTEFASITFPAPEDAVVDSQGFPDMANGAISAFLANFQSGQYFRISDGETANQLEATGKQDVKKPRTYNR